MEVHTSPLPRPFPIRARCLTHHQNTTQQQPYRDSPPSTPSHHTSTSSASTSTIKPSPALPTPHAPAYEPYCDDPPTPTDSSRCLQEDQREPYTDTLTPLTPNDDENIPLAHLLLNPYPHEAPPSYSVAVRQTLSHRDTLVQYIPSTSLRPVLIEIDDESGEVLSRTDDVRHSVEKVVAMFVVAGLLLILSGVLAWLAVGSGVLGS
ncbi:hypothetical protein BDU57DRAFT_549732 [Ampelomyces quisqualis]|uniref:Uncharacterized protein n=1 Tax=Ampelomyces quisqualis TaxID=50730 RepID=A0A6A5QGG1_AMPQU|nr:hypothetical protein BDU57DRAFT_549732 [Ampelomyces quisqualis]